MKIKAEIILGLCFVVVALLAGYGLRSVTHHDRLVPIHFPSAQAGVRNSDSSYRAPTAPVAKIDSGIPKTEKGDTVVRKIDFVLRGCHIRDTVHDTVDGVVHSIECPPCPDISGSVTLVKDKDGARSVIKTDSGEVVSAIDRQTIQGPIQKPRIWAAGIAYGRDMIRGEPIYGAWGELRIKRVSVGLMPTIGTGSAAITGMIGFTF